MRRHSTFWGVSLRLIYITSAILSLSTHLYTHAQPYQPVLTVQPGNAFVEGKGLYILSGGDTRGLIAAQTFMIDLSVSWNTMSPAYKSLPLGPGSNWFPSAMSADGQRWFVLVNGGAYVFDIRSSKWTQVFNSPDLKGQFGLGAATDPETGMVFIPFGFKKPDGTFNMLIVDLNGSYRSDNDDLFKLPQTRMYALTWNSLLKSLLFLNESGMFTYSLMGGWKNFNSPPGLTATSSYCMVSSSSGAKVVLFGGYSKSLNASVGDIFILDVPTLTWKKGPVTPPRDVRRSPACAISNNQFIVWGGDTGNINTVVPPDNMMLVYSLKTDSWTSEYTAPSSNPTHTSLPGNDTAYPTSTPSSTSTASSENTSGRREATGAMQRAYLSRKTKHVHWDSTLSVFNICKAQKSRDASICGDN
ncbi:hypothetical protein BGX34_008258 [Mortierella sp. NVP85]|nr:hypothetical protein BGX34_008258 [Mortierella sp. NVP85]